MKRSTVQLPIGEQKKWQFMFLKVDDRAAMGLAMGTASHGIGTGRMLEIDPLGGAIAGLAIGLNGLITSFLLPLPAAFLAR